MIYTAAKIKLKEDLLNLKKLLVLSIGIRAADGIFELQKRYMSLFIVVPYCTLELKSNPQFPGAVFLLNFVLLHVFLFLPSINSILYNLISPFLPVVLFYVCFMGSGQVAWINTDFNHSWMIKMKPALALYAKATCAFQVF